MTVTSSSPDRFCAAVRSNLCRSRLRPPANIAAPSTSSALPITDPTSDAFTTSCSPSSRAKKAMINSGAFPNVTLSRPAIPGPDRPESCSVAVPITAAPGTTASAEVKNTSVGVASASFSTRATGTKMLR